MKYPTLRHTLILILALCCTPTSSNQDATGTRGTPAPVIMAYYVPDRNFEPEEVPVEKLTHIIYAFTHVIDGEMKSASPKRQVPNWRRLSFRKNATQISES